MRGLHVLYKGNLKNIHTPSAIIAAETYTTERFSFHYDAQPDIDWEISTRHSCPASIISLFCLTLMVGSRLTLQLSILSHSNELLNDTETEK